MSTICFCVAVIFFYMSLLRIHVTEYDGFANPVGNQKHLGVNLLGRRFLSFHPEAFVCVCAVPAKFGTQQMQTCNLQYCALFPDDLFPALVCLDPGSLFLAAVAGIHRKLPFLCTHRLFPRTRSGKGRYLGSCPLPLPSSCLLHPDS